MKNNLPYVEIKAFLSSTFNDMIAERDFFIDTVFPMVKEFCRKHKIIFSYVDLLWGITEEEANEYHKTVSLCLKLVNETNPLFVCLLGDRYGWTPTQSDVDEFDISQNEGVSMTEMEILQATQNLYYQGEKSDTLFFLRDEKTILQLDKSEQEKYIEEDNQKRAKLDKLRTFIKKAQNHTIYSATFNHQKSTFENFTSNGEDLAKVAFNMIIDTLKNREDLKTHFEKEVVDYDDEIQNYLLFNYADSQPIELLDELVNLYVNSGSLRFIAGVEGLGKKCALARYIVANNDKNPYIFYRFMSKNYASITMETFVASLAKQFAQIEACECVDFYDEQVDFICKTVEKWKGEGKKPILLLGDIDSTLTNMRDWCMLFYQLGFCSTLCTISHQYTIFDDSLPFIPYLPPQDTRAIAEFLLAKRGKKLSSEQLDLIGAQVQTASLVQQFITLLSSGYTHEQLAIKIAELPSYGIDSLHRDMLTTLFKRSKVANIDEQFTTLLLVTLLACKGVSKRTMTYVVRAIEPQLDSVQADKIVERYLALMQPYLICYNNHYVLQDTAFFYFLNGVYLNESPKFFKSIAKITLTHYLLAKDCIDFDEKDLSNVTNILGFLQSYYQLDTSDKIYIDMFIDTFYSQKSIDSILTKVNIDYVIEELSFVIKDHFNIRYTALDPDVYAPDIDRDAYRILNLTAKKSFEALLNSNDNFAPLVAYKKLIGTQ